MDTYISTLFVVLDATGVDKELADCLEGALTVFTEVEVVIGEDVNDVTDDGRVYFLELLAQDLVHHRARNVHHRRLPLPLLLSTSPFSYPCNT